MTERGEKICAWMVIPAALFFFLAIIPALNFVPPLSPQLSAQEFSEIYRENIVGVQVGSILMLLGGAFLMPFISAISSAMYRMGGKPSALALTQLTSGVFTFVTIFLAGLFFAAVGFRADRPDEIILALSDIAWLFLVMPTPPFLVGLLAIGLAVLADDSPKPVFPRWIAYLNFWIGILAIGGVLVPLFKTGPFAWNGLMAFWVPLNVFGIWMISMLWALVKAGPGTSEA
ncbi:hypothetical protein [Agrobacterium radiobacter]|uniref:hypothetical protein n=1 Tax=Agrobacterium radiobacter TaxID=362 RepID=UPI003F825CAF